LRKLYLCFQITVKRRAIITETIEGLGISVSVQPSGLSGQLSAEKNLPDAKQAQKGLSSALQIIDEPQ